MDFKNLQEFIKNVAKTGIAEVVIETPEMKIKIRNQFEPKKEAEQGFYGPASVHFMHQAPHHQPMPAAAAPPPEKPREASDESSRLVTIKSPMVGTFYSKPSPDKPAYVEVGGQVSPGKVVCIIEAMKLFNEIEAEVSGKLVKVLVEDSSPVEFDQPLFLIDPS